MSGDAKGVEEVGVVRVVSVEAEWHLVRRTTKDSKD